MIQMLNDVKRVTSSLFIRRVMGTEVTPSFTFTTSEVLNGEWVVPGVCGA
jgi:hypothetical protein